MTKPDRGSMTPKQFALGLVLYLKAETPAHVHEALQDVADYVEQVDTELQRLEDENDRLRKGK